MPNTFKSVQSTVNLVSSLAYTVPADTTAVVIGMRFGNKLLTPITITARLVKGATRSNLLGQSTLVSAGSALEGVTGSKLVMEAGNQLEIEGSEDGCADLTLSVMEIS